MGSGFLNSDALRGALAMANGVDPDAPEEWRRWRTLHPTSPGDALSSLLHEVEQRYLLFIFQERVLSALDRGRDFLETLADEVKIPIEDLRERLDQSDREIDQFQPGLDGPDAPRSYDDLKHALDERERLSSELKEKESNLLRILNKSISLKEHITDWTKINHHRTAVDLCSLLEVFMRDFLIESVLSCGQVIERESKGRLKASPRSVGKMDSDLRSEMISLLNDRGRSLQSPTGLEEIYWMCLRGRGSDGNAETIPDDIALEEQQSRGYLRSDIKLLFMLRNVIVHAGGNSGGERHGSTLKECRPNLPEDERLSAAAPDPILILSGDSPRRSTMCKTQEFCFSVATFAHGFADRLTPPDGATISKDLFW